MIATHPVQVVNEIPKEECKLRSHRRCSPVTKTLPRAVTEGECIMVPAEKCGMQTVIVQRKT